MPNIEISSEKEIAFLITTITEGKTLLSIPSDSTTPEAQATHQRLLQAKTEEYIAKAFYDRLAEAHKEGNLEAVNRFYSFLLHPDKIEKLEYPELKTTILDFVKALQQERASQLLSQLWSREKNRLLRKFDQINFHDTIRKELKFLLTLTYSQEGATLSAKNEQTIEALLDTQSLEKIIPHIYRVKNPDDFLARAASALKVQQLTLLYQWKIQYFAEKIALNDPYTLSVLEAVSSATSCALIFGGILVHFEIIALLATLNALEGITQQITINTAESTSVTGQVLHYSSNASHALLEFTNYYSNNAFTLTSTTFINAVNLGCHIPLFVLSKGGYYTQKLLTGLQPSSSDNPEPVKSPLLLTWGASQKSTPFLFSQTSEGDTVVLTKTAELENDDGYLMIESPEVEGEETEKIKRQTLNF